MIRSSSRPGYAFLVTVLLIGAIATTVVASLLLLAIGTSKSSLSIQQSALALAHARSCAERALATLRTDGTSTGDFSLTLTDGTCRVLAIGGEGNETRTLCTEGTVGQVTRKLEIEIASVLPTIVIRSWREVAAFSLCP